MSAAVFALGLTSFSFAGDTNSVPVTVAPLPDLGSSLVRVFGALLLVLGLFLGGVWVFRNWQRIAAKNGRAPKLNVLEVRSLGGRQTIYVVGYERERMLLASGPAGVSYLSQLPLADEDSAKENEHKPAAPTFSAALAKVLRGK